jgi:hypothetical protein
MAYRSEIIRALDELMADEVGMRFQGIAVVHAKRKWPQLVSCERKWDGGLDAHADGTLEPNGKGIGLASSTTPTIAKIKHDAKNTKEHYPDVKVLIFSTAGVVTEHQKKPWVEEIQRDFGLHLIVVSREEFITWLLDPTQSDICRDQLGIPVSMPTELEPVLESAQEAAKETADKWDHWYRKPGRPLINLTATKLSERGEPVEAATTDSLAAALEEGQRIVLEAPAGSGKTMALVQFALRILSGGGLPFLVDLPEWVSSHRKILAFVAEYPAFAARGLDAALLSKLRGKQPPTFLLNGWNEVAIANAAAADAALRDLERTFPASTIVVTTRLHRLIPPLRDVSRVQLNQLDRAKRNEYLDRALGAAAHDLKVKLDSNRTLGSITRTPLILAEVADLHRAGKEIPPTKMGVLGAVLHEIEQSAEHRVPLQQAPLRGHAANYLHALSMKMTELGETTIADLEARVVVNSISDSLRVEGRIMSPPDPSEVLDELAKRHVLVPSHQGEFTFRFQHQQFQEFYAAEGLRRFLLGVVARNDAADERKFAKEYVNEPRWGESLRMLAEDIAERSTRTEFVEAGARLVRMALHIDPIFAADLASASGTAVWARVRGDVGKRFRGLYAQKNPHYRHCALAAMLVTESDDFKDIIVPLLAHPDAQVRLGVYHSGAEVLPGSLGPNWRDLVRSWPEEARLDFVAELGHNPWFADSVEEIALSDTSPKVRWNAAQVLSWYGFIEKAEKLLKSIDDASVREVLRAARPDEIPDSQWPRIVTAYEQMYKEASDPFGRLRLLYSLQAFGGTNVIGRMKAELDALGPDQLTSRDNERLIRWALDEVQKSDSKWVSEWATRKVLDTSIWTGDWRGLITEIPNHEAEELYSRFGSEVLDEGEKRRVVAVLISVMNAELAARLFGRACEIYSGLSFPPGHDQAKWNLFGQVKDLLRAVSPAMLLDGISEKLRKEPQANELDVLTDTLPATKLTKPDTRSSISEGMRAKLRAYLKRGAKLGFDPDGIRSSTRAHLAQLLANVGEPEDLEDIRRLIEADSVRFDKAYAARMKGDRSHDVTGYGFLYLEAVTTVDPVAAEDVVVDLIGLQQYDHVLSQRLPVVAKKSVEPPTLSTNRVDFGRIWRARAGEVDDTFVEKRRVLFSDAIRGQIDRINTDREAAADKAPFDYRLKILAGPLAVLDGKRSASLVLELMALPGRWDGWTRVGAIESLLDWGVRLSIDEMLKILDPVIDQLRSSGVYDDQNSWLFARCLVVMAFTHPPAPGIAKIRALISELHFRPYQLDNVVSALGASRCDDAIDVLMEFAGADGKGVEAVGESWIKAIGALEGERSSEILLSFVDPKAKMFDREVIPDHRHGDLLARVLAERAMTDKSLKDRLVEMTNGDLTLTKRTLLAKVFNRFSDEEDRVKGLCLLHDDGSGVPYELVRSLENAFLERRPYGSGSNAFTLVPRGSNLLRKRLFEMSQTDPHRKHSAFALLGQIESWRLEHGHPVDEPRHPAIESEVSWPPLH